MVFVWQEHKDITDDDQQKSECKDLCARKGGTIENTGKVTKLNQTQLLIAHSSLISYPASLHLFAPVLLMKQLRSRTGKRKKKKLPPNCFVGSNEAFQLGWKETFPVGSVCLFGLAVLNII